MLTVQLRYFASIREDLNCDGESWQTHVSSEARLSNAWPQINLCAWP